MLNKKRFHSFAAGIFSGGVVLFLFQFGELIQMHINAGLLASIALIVVGGGYLYYEYRKDPQAYIKAHDEIQVKRKHKKKKAKDN